MNLVTITSPQSVASEAYRTLRTNLYFAALETPFKTLVLTAPTHQDDKSAAVANLAVVIAQTDKRVIIVDADLRHPTQHKLFGLKNEAGLSNMLGNATAFVRMPLQETTVSGLQVLSSGPIPDVPSDALNSRKMAQLIATLREQADLVIFDTPATAIASDAAILASQTDAALLVLTSGKTRREHAQAAKDLLNRAKARLLGAVLLNAKN
ncbi:MAG: CpsD/CapB family tyrosine-protein kinase [Anaerolineae bacterium]|nr:CpsD/CapB family tyrosine-protein kinase [Anaerolineae bacterium]